MFHHLDSATLIKITRFYFFWRKCCHFDFRQGMGFTRIVKKIFERNCENWSENEFTSFADNAITLIFARGRDSLGFSKKKGEKDGENWSEIEFTSLGENAITSIFAKRWDSLRFSKKKVKKKAKIGQKINSVSYLALSYPEKVNCNIHDNKQW